MTDQLDALPELDDSLYRAMDERDAAQDALADTHIALGGDGKWVARMPQPNPPDSGDLVLDVPVLASEVLARAEKAEARVQELERENGRLTENLAAVMRSAQAEHVHAEARTTELRGLLDSARGRAAKAESELAAIKKRIADDYERGRQDGINFGPSVREQIDNSRELDEDTLDGEAKS